MERKHVAPALALAAGAVMVVVVVYRLTSAMCWDLLRATDDLVQVATAASSPAPASAPASVPASASMDDASDASDASGCSCKVRSIHLSRAGSIDERLGAIAHLLRKPPFTSYRGARLLAVRHLRFGKPGSSSSTQLPHGRRLVLRRLASSGERFRFRLTLASDRDVPRTSTTCSIAPDKSLLVVDQAVTVAITCRPESQ